MEVFIAPKILETLTYWIFLCCMDELVMTDSDGFLIFRNLMKIHYRRMEIFLQRFSENTLYVSLLTYKFLKKVTASFRHSHL